METSASRGPAVPVEFETRIEEKDLRFYDVRRDPFEVYGLYDARRQPVFRRLPGEVAEAVSEGVRGLALNTAGGRVRFSTDSRYVAIRAVMPSVSDYSHMPRSGASGLDMDLDQPGGSAFYGLFMPPLTLGPGGYEGILYFPDRRMRSLTVRMPLYNPLDALYIGLQEGARLEAGCRYRVERPVLYYGSSITQGGCASRPGNSYEAIISRRLDCDYINLGFSGNAKGEPVLVDYMAGLDVSAFVCDYDHNAPTPAHLEATHEPLYRRYRRSRPRTPILFVTRPDYDTDPVQCALRRDIIFETYRKARRDGDERVYFVDGQRLFGGENRDCCTVDGCHPNDAGFVRMADTIGSTLRQALEAARED